jgi:hypothetical protein
MMVLPLPELMPQPALADFGPVLERLGASAFRRRKRLLGLELEYVRARGVEDVVRHAATFITERVAPASPADDGRQTPYRGHPSFTAQHATATCCRNCLEVAHAIPRTRPLSPAEIRWVVGLIRAWLCQQMGLPVPAAPAAVEPAAARRPRVRHNLRLIPAEWDMADDAHVLEECGEGGDVVRRWLQLELFGPA